MALLTERQAQALSLYAAGHRAPEVAAHMGVGRERVKDLLEGARTALGARTTYQAVALAVSLGHIDVAHGQGARFHRVREKVIEIAALLDMG